MSSSKRSLEKQGIITEGICIRYNGQQVLRNVSLTLKRGEVITLLGPNGCGKTTLLKNDLDNVFSLPYTFHPYGKLRSRREK
jgi:ABC-type bacteriocin/lantibiotic exporter with double-glycine peptidase domain